LPAQPAVGSQPAAFSLVRRFYQLSMEGGVPATNLFPTSILFFCRCRLDPPPRGSLRKALVTISPAEGGVFATCCSGRRRRWRTGTRSWRRGCEHRRRSTRPSCTPWSAAISASWRPEGPRGARRAGGGVFRGFGSSPVASGEPASCHHFDFKKVRVKQGAVCHIFSLDAQAVHALALAWSPYGLQSCGWTAGSHLGLCRRSFRRHGSSTSGTAGTTDPAIDCVGACFSQWEHAVGRDPWG